MREWVKDGECEHTERKRSKVMSWEQGKGEIMEMGWEGVEESCTEHASPPPHREKVLLGSSAQSPHAPRHSLFGAITNTSSPTEQAPLVCF